MKAINNKMCLRYVQNAIIFEKNVEIKFQVLPLYMSIIIVKSS